ncbi:MAG TPA: cytochrome c [Egibacteraceae bacterium]|nr:cytochrome c [Egibacteraceae bacterium]
MQSFHALRRGAAAVGLLLLSVAGCARPAPADDPAELARGAELYEANCAECHGGAIGGDIADIPPRHNAEGHTWHHPDCELVDIVLNGMPQRLDFPEMPAHRDRLSEDDVNAILAHIKTWWTPEQRAHQEEVTEQVCD